MLGFGYDGKREGEEQEKRKSLRRSRVSARWKQWMQLHRVSLQSGILQKLTHRYGSTRHAISPCSLPGLPVELHLIIISFLSDACGAMATLNLRLINRYFYQLLSPLTMQQLELASASIWASSKALLPCSQCLRLRYKVNFTTTLYWRMRNDGAQVFTAKATGCCDDCKFEAPIEEYFLFNDKVAKDSYWQCIGCKQKVREAGFNEYGFFCRPCCKLEAWKKAPASRHKRTVRIGRAIVFRSRRDRSR